MVKSGAAYFARCNIYEAVNDEVRRFNRAPADGTVTKRQLLNLDQDKIPALIGGSRGQILQLEKDEAAAADLRRRKKRHPNSNLRADDNSNNHTGDTVDNYDSIENDINVSTSSQHSAIEVKFHPGYPISPDEVLARSKHFRYDVAIRNRDDFPGANPLLYAPYSIVPSGANDEKTSKANKPVKPVKRGRGKQKQHIPNDDIIDSNNDKNKDPPECLPDSDLLQMIHYYFTQRLQSMRSEVAHHLIERQWDETALIAVGLLVEDMVEEFLTGSVGGGAGPGGDDAQGEAFKQFIDWKFSKEEEDRLTSGVADNGDDSDDGDDGLDNDDLEIGGLRNNIRGTDVGDAGNFAGGDGSNDCNDEDNADSDEFILETNDELSGQFANAKSTQKRAPGSKPKSKSKSKAEIKAKISIPKSNLQKMPKSGASPSITSTAASENPNAATSTTIRSSTRSKLGTTRNKNKSKTATKNKKSKGIVKPKGKGKGKGKVLVIRPGAGLE